MVLRPHLGRSNVTIPLHQPVPVEPFLEVEQGLSKLFDGVEGPHPEQLLFEGGDETLGYPVAPGKPNETGAGLDVQEGDLLLKGVTHVLQAVVAPHDQACSDVFGQRAVVFWWMGPRASKRVPGREAWMPTASPTR